MYLVNEVFYTLQGEGFHSGRAAVFCRFSKCNLWTGREDDRASAVCKFCDTDFTSGTKVGGEELADQICSLWPDGGTPMVVFTGGEPLLQLDEELVMLLKYRGFYVAVETNGTRPVPNGVDWVCVSPKILTRLVVTSADELKLVYPQDDVKPEQLNEFASDLFWLSPMDGPELRGNTAAAIEYVKSNPRWRLNVQSHKIWGIR